MTFRSGHNDKIFIFHSLNSIEIITLGILSMTIVLTRIYNFSNYSDIMQKNSVYIVIVLFVFAVFSCDNKNSNNQSVTSEVNDVLYDSVQGKSFVYTKYELPLSVEV
jgi:hypothetical protein